MVENYHHHPKMMDEIEKMKLPERSFHPKLQDRYPANSTIELSRRAQDLFYREIALQHMHAVAFPDTSVLQPASSLLDVVESPVDIVAPVLTVRNKENETSLMLVEDHIRIDHQNYSMGKSLIVQKLLKLPPFEEVLHSKLDIESQGKIPAERLVQGLIYLTQFTHSPTEKTIFQLASGDVTYLARSLEGELVALPLVGRKEDATWDLARSGVRRLVNEYDRNDPNIRSSQIKLSEKLIVDECIWTAPNSAFPLTDIIFLREDTQLSNEAAWTAENSTSMDYLDEIRYQLYQNPLYLAPLTNYWKIDVKQHYRAIDNLLSQGLNNHPEIRFLSIRSPKDTTHLDAAAELISNLYT